MLALTRYCISAFFLLTLDWLIIDHYLYSTLGGLNCIVKRRIYNGKLSFLTNRGDSGEQTAAQVCHDTDSQDQSQRDTTVTIEVHEEKEKEGEAVVEGDTPTTEQTGSQESSTDPTPPATQVIDNTPQESESEQTVASDSNEPADQENGEQHQPKETVDVRQFGPKADLLVPLSEPVPSSWEVLEGEFLAITVLMIPHMARSFFGDAEFNIGTGKFRIVICEGRMSRLGMLGLLTKADTGAHLDMDEVVRKEAIAFRLEPQTTPGLLTVDGEQMYYGPLQGQIHPGLARVMCRKRRS